MAILFRRTLWRLLQKRVVCTKFDINLFFLSVCFRVRICWRQLEENTSSHWNASPTIPSSLFKSNTEESGVVETFEWRQGFCYHFLIKIFLQIYRWTVFWIYSRQTNSTNEKEFNYLHLGEKDWQICSGRQNMQRWILF